MEQFNKALSFILGLVVVAVFIVVASGKFNIKGVNLSKSGTSPSVTPQVTPLVTPKPTSKPWFSFGVKPTAVPIKAVAVVKPTPITSQLYTSTNVSNKGANQYTNTNVPSSIPNTGVPIVLFPLLGSSLLTGIFMKKSGTKGKI